MSSSRFCFVLAAGAGALLLFAGCGGGGNGVGGGAASGGDNVAQVGGLQISYKGGQLQPFVSSVGDVSVTTMTGGNFSTINYAALNDISQTAIAYSRKDQIWTV